MRLPRIELLHEARVNGVSVLLSDLLPESAGVALRERAREISLGASPQLGNTRILERSGILENIGANLNFTANVDVPERIVVSRVARAISTGEVFAAIRRVLERNGNPAAAGLHPEDILLQTQVLVGPGDAGLEVLRSDFDAGLKRGRFLLWPSQYPRVLPFVVTVRFAINSPLAVFRLETKPNGNGGEHIPRPVQARAPKPEVLVSPGEQATLILRSDVLRMTADVVPLERGTMGQQVRVRVVDTGKIFNAQVDGRAHLAVRF